VITYLSLLSTALRELKVDTLARQPLVDLRVGIESVINTTPLLLVQHDLENLGAIFLRSDALADNLNWVDEIVQDAVVNGGECAGSWTLLLLRCAAAVGALWARENATGSNDEDVAVGELLLKLAGEALLRLVPSRKQRYGDEDDNCFPAVANLNL